MRIVMATVRYPPAPGGAETHAHALARRFVAAGHEVIVHTSDLETERPFVHAAMPDDIDGVRVVRHKAYSPGPMLHYTFLPALGPALQRDARAADVVHAHSYGYGHTTVAGIAARRAGVPFVLTPHYHPPWSMEGGKARRVLRRIFDPAIGQPTLNLADALVFVSSGERKAYETHMRVPSRARVEVIPNGFDAARYDPLPDGPAFRARHGLPAKAPVILQAGRLASNKGLPTLIDAFARVRARAPDAFLVLVGQDQGWRDRLLEQARERGVADHLHIVGHLSDAAYAEALAAADVFVLASEWEAFGIVLAEAMACATPVVATRVGGAPDVVVDGQTGHLVPYGDADALAAAIARVLTDPQGARTMGRAGRAHALSAFSWDAVAVRTLDLYEALRARS